MKKNIVSNIFLFLFIGGFIFAITYFGISYYKDRNELDENNKITEGIVIKSKSFFTKRGKDIVIKYQYDVDGKTYENTNSSDTLLKVGDKCKVKYSVIDPSNSKLIPK
jgi:hypothetical protein